MEPTPQPPTPPTTVVTPPPPQPGMFGTKVPSSVTFLVGILLFLLPFAEIKCGGTVIAKNTGLGIAMGKEWQSVSSKSMFGVNDNDDKGMETNGKKKQDPNMYAIIALGLAVLGLLLSFTNAKAAIGSAILTGVLSAGTLIGLMLDLQKKVKTDMGGNAGNNNDAGNMFGLDKLNDVKMTISFTPWFYIAIIAFLAAAFFSYLRMRTPRS
jgi:hypothetical protein